MKLIKYLYFVAFIILLVGCDVKEDTAWECISDEIESFPSSYLSMALPENVFLTESSRDGRLGLFSHKDYEIIQEVFSADNTAEAIRHISGQELQPITLPDGSARFSWVSGQEMGMLCCSAVLLTDGEYYYSLCIRCPAVLEKNYREVFSEILASVRLESV